MGAVGQSYGALDAIALNRRQRRPTTREQISERIAGLRAQIEKHERVLKILVIMPFTNPSGRMARRLPP